MGGAAALPSRCSPPPARRSAILPLPYAFATSGAVGTTLILIFVALTNV